MENILQYSIHASKRKHRPQIVFFSRSQQVLIPNQSSPSLYTTNQDLYSLIDFDIWFVIVTRQEDDPDDDLLVQLDVFEESRLEDDDEQFTPEGVDLTSHIDVFHAIFKRVSLTSLSII